MLLWASETCLVTALQSASPAAVFRERGAYGVTRPIEILCPFQKYQLYRVDHIRDQLGRHRPLLWLATAIPTVCRTPRRMPTASTGLVRIEILAERTSARSACRNLCCRRYLQNFIQPFQNTLLPMQPFVVMRQR
jgi:hypothetical protein